MARPAMFASVISLKRLPGLLDAMTSGAAANPADGDANAASLISGAATVQACGTDNVPTVGARSRGVAPSRACGTDTSPPVGACPRPAVTDGSSAGPTAIAGRVNP